MRSSFRRFIEAEDGAPFEMGAPPPSDPQQTHDDSRVMDKEFDITAAERKVADASMSFTLHKPLTLPSGVKLSPPTEVSLEPLDNGNYKLRVLETNRQKMQDQSGSDWHGKIDNTEIIVSKAFVETQLKAAALKTLGGGGMALPPMPGGMPGGMM